MEKEIPKTYTAKDWEDKLYAQWEKSGFFNPDICVRHGITKEDAEPFSIVLPPPNVTGTLHTGSACMLAIEDLIVRFKRMQGYRTLWLPGTDHAAIATQSKVERIIYEQEGKTRHDLGREELLRRIEKFAQESHDTIVHQTKKLGSSLDWSREAYTLDQARSLAVRTAFKKMYDDGIIYQGERIVNWDPKMQTTVSDDEIEWKTENTSFYYLQYGPFVISTARPETKFGDKYVVMHPDDERYTEFKHGDKLAVEWINGSVEATVIKDETIDQSFGTGVMTITPWHDNTDFDIAERHHLDKEQIIDEQGRLLPIAGEFSGMPILEVREKIITKLKEKGLVKKIEENYAHNVATNSRGGGLIEPQIKKQWFIGVTREFERDGKKTTLKSLMLAAVQSGKTHILPERFEKTYFHWVNNLRDWCISRQIWYGHRIPVWYKEGEVFCGIETPKGEGWVQDPDTLDTWFSSGLWTFSTLGWPDPQADDFNIYHPTSLLETGYDILPFWVSRMILMSTYLLNEVPFKTVYLHGLVRDEKGRKMSKSLDNIIDPLDVIAVHGADALRLALVIGSSPGNDIRVGEEKIESYRNFANKLWNIGRYISQSTASLQGGSVSREKSSADHWILSRLKETTTEVTVLIENYQLSLAGEKLRDFTWNEYADWYVEIHKIEKNDAVLVSVWNDLLKLWHPFMPFVTEALFQTLYPNEKTLLMVASWPKANANTTTDTSFQTIIDLIQRIRNVRAVYHVDPNEKPWLTIVGTKADWEHSIPLIERLARIEKIIITDDQTQPTETARIISGNTSVFVHLTGLIDLDKERARLTAEMESAQKYKQAIEKRLNDPDFTGRAPAHIIEQNHASLIETDKKIHELSKYLKDLAL